MNIGFQRAAVFRKKKHFLAGVILKKGLSREKEVSEIKNDYKNKIFSLGKSIQSSSCVDWV